MLVAKRIIAGRFQIKYIKIIMPKFITTRCQRNYVDTFPIRIVKTIDICLQSEK